MLHATEGCRRIRDHAGVVADQTELQAGRHARKARVVARVHVRRQTVLGVVGELQGGALTLLAVAAEGGNRGDGAEDLFTPHAHRISHAGQHGGANEVALVKVLGHAAGIARNVLLKLGNVPAAGQDRTLAQGVFDHKKHGFNR